MVSEHQGNFFKCWSYEYLQRQLFDALSYRIEIYNLRCPFCGYYHVDHSEWATRAHKTHLCENCNREFEAPYKGVSNLLASEKIVPYHVIIELNKVEI